VSLTIFLFFAETAGKHAGLNESRPEDFIDVSNIHISPCADMLTSCRITIWCIQRAHMSPHVIDNTVYQNNKQIHVVYSLNPSAGSLYSNASRHS